jgi:hypothetical protein
MCSVHIVKISAKVRNYLQPARLNIPLAPFKGGITNTNLLILKPEYYNIVKP